MMRIQLTIFLFLIQGYAIVAQQLKVIDKSNLRPVDNVAVYNLDHTKTTLTNIDGIADFSEFNSNDTVIFQHPSFQHLILPYNTIKNHNFVITLTESTVNLSEVVVSASKWEQDINEVPRQIVSIDAKEIEFYNPQTTADLLGSSNEVFIQKSQLGGGSPMIRGFAANSVLLVVDGVRMNNAIFRSGNLQNVIVIDPNIIDEAEVIFGPGSIMYGSDALGGVMDFHTKKIELPSDSSYLYSANALARYSSADNELTGHFDFGYSENNWGALTSISYSRFDDLKMGSIGHPDYQRKEYVIREGNSDKMVVNDDPDVQKFSGYNQLNILQKFRYRINGKVDLSLSLQYSSTSNIPRYDRLTQYKNDSTLKYAEWYYGPQIWGMGNLTVNLKNDHGIYDEARIVLGYQNVEESRYDRKFGKDSRRGRVEALDIFTLNFDLTKTLSEKNTLYYGLETFYNKVKSTAGKTNIVNGETEPAATRYPDGGSNYSSASAYADFKSRLSTKVTLLAGARYSYVWLKSKFNDKTFYPFPYDEIDLSTGALNGSLGLVYRPVSKLNVTANISSGFRAPNVDDISKVFDSEPGNVIVPNPDLKPEYAYNTDLGLTFSFSENAKVNITGFYTYLVDAMVRRDFTLNGQDSIVYDGEMSKVQALVNAGSAQIYGGSFGFEANITKSLGFKTGLTYMKGKDNDGYPVRHVSPLFGNAGLTYIAKNLKLEAYLNYNGEISYENLALSERKKTYMYATDSNGNPYSPSWYTLNFIGYYQINKYFQVNFGIENILDHRYRPYSSGIVSPGRNFIIALRAAL